MAFVNIYANNFDIKKQQALYRMLFKDLMDELEAVEHYNHMEAVGQKIVPLEEIADKCQEYYKNNPKYGYTSREYVVWSEVQREWDANWRKAYHDKELFDYDHLKPDAVNSRLAPVAVAKSTGKPCKMCTKKKERCHFHL